MSKILRSTHVLLAAQDRFQWKHAHDHPLPAQSAGVRISGLETGDAVHPRQEVHQRIVAQGGHGRGEHRAAFPGNDADEPNELSRGQLHPDVGVERGGGDPLQDRRRHPGYLEPDAFLAERPDKPCERRKFSCRCQRSSGVALRLIAQSTRSSGESSGNLESRRSSASYFFLFNGSQGIRDRAAGKVVLLGSPDAWRAWQSAFVPVPSIKCLSLYQKVVACPADFWWNAGMRQARLRAPAEWGVSHYHVVSRVVNREFVLGDEEREQFVKLMRLYERLCGVRILTYCILSNHFHLLVEVPRRREQPLSEDQLLMVVRKAYGNSRAKALEVELHQTREMAGEEKERELIESWQRRMWDLSEFMKTLKQRFTQWFNKKHAPYLICLSLYQKRLALFPLISTISRHETTPFESSQRLGSRLLPLRLPRRRSSLRSRGRRKAAVPPLHEVV